MVIGCRQMTTQDMGRKCDCGKQIEIKWEEKGGE